MEKELQTPNVLIDGLEKLFANCLDVAKAKNKDYAGDANPFANFENAKLAKVSVEQGIIVRIVDKLSRTSNLIASGKDPAVIGESLLDTVLDIVNYAGILYVYIDENNQKKAIFKRQEDREANSGVIPKF